MEATKARALRIKARIAYGEDVREGLDGQGLAALVADESVEQGLVPASEYDAAYSIIAEAITEARIARN